MQLQTVLGNLASPLGLLAVGLGALAGMVVACFSNTSESTQAFLEQKAALEQAKAASDEARESFDRLKEQQAKQIEQTESQYAHTQTLWEELKGLADENGVIQEKDAERAKVLAELLNPTLGQTIQLNKDGTATLTDEAEAIDVLLEKKRAQAILAAKEPTYNEAVANSMGLLTRQRELDASMQARQLEINTLTQQAMEELKKGNVDLAAQIGVRVAQETDLMQSEQAEYNDNKETLKGYYETISDYEGTLTAIQQGNYDTRTGLKQSEIDSAHATTAEMEKAYADRIGMEQIKYDTMLEQSQQKNSAITQAELDAQRQRVENEKSAMLEMYLAELAGGKELSLASSQNARGMLSAYASLPQDQKEAAVRAMLAQAKGIEEQIPALKNAANMSADEIISTITTHLSNSEADVTKRSNMLGELMAYGVGTSYDLINATLNKTIVAFGSTATLSAAEWIANMTMKKASMTSTVASIFSEVARAAQANLPTVKLSVPGSTSRYNKSGLEYVWEDNMPVRVHKGEAILTAEEARVWRAQKGLTTYDDVAAMYARAMQTVQTEASGMSRRMSVGEQRRLAFAKAQALQGAPHTVEPRGKYVANVTLVADGRELARVSAPFMGSQLAWEG